jgi:hypothetical protein
MVERASGRTVEGGERSEVTELRTFMRARGGNLAALRHPADLMFDNSSAAPTKWHSPRGRLRHVNRLLPTGEYRAALQHRAGVSSAASGC